MTAPVSLRDETDEDGVRVVGLVGTGSVGSGWAAAHLAKGHALVAYDPDPRAPERLAAFLNQAWPSLRALGLTDEAAPDHGRVRFTSLAEVAATSDCLHENVPERLEAKRDALMQIERAARPDILVLSSSGGLMPSDIQAGMAHPERLVVAHPFNPPHLVPLVEVLGGRLTAPSAVERTMRLMTRLGKRPVRLEREATAYMANRLQFALLREATHCLVEGIASPEAIDDAIRFALAPRWAVMGGLMTFALAGGEEGMPAVVEKFGASTQAWWSALGTPSLSPEVGAALIDAARSLQGDRTIQEHMALRDRRLVAMLQLLQGQDA